MRAGLSTIQQTLTPEAASVLNHSIAEAGRRNHGQTTPLHVAATLLASPSGFLRQACIRSHPNSSHPLQCRALELCFSVALERLPTAQNMSPGMEPPISNALMAALKRAQAHQRRGCPEQQQQPLLAVKVELEQLIISILDDPSVSRVMREASFSSPAVKATIEQTLNSSSPGNVNPVNIGIGFRPSPSPTPISMTVPNRNLYLNPRLQQGSEAQLGQQRNEEVLANRNLYLNPRLQQGNSGQSGQQRNDDVKRVIDILLRTKKRNPVLVGESEPEAVIKEILRRIEKGELVEEPLKTVQVMSIEKELASDKEQAPAKIKELGDLIETRIGSSSCGGIIVDLGDLKWLVEQPTSSGVPQQIVAEVGREAVAEMGKLLGRFKEEGGGNGKIWLVGTATCETYLRCQVYHPSMESDWDLQAVPIASRSPLPGMFSRIGTNGILSSSVESLHPLKSLTSALSMPRRLSENLDPARKVSCCPQCSVNYEQELAKLVDKEVEKSGDEVKSEASRPTLPQWLQNATVQSGGEAKTTDQSQIKDQELLVKQKTQELQKKWSDTCSRLHPNFHHNPRPERIVSTALPMTGLFKPNPNPNLLMRQQPIQPKLQPPRNLQATLQPSRNLQPTLHLNPNQRASQLSESASSPPGSPVRTDLVLGPTKVTETTPPKIHEDLPVKDLLSCISSQPHTKYPEFQKGKFASVVDADSFKKLLKGLMKKAWWQPEAASALATTVTQGKLVEGNRGGTGSKGSTWLLFAGPDRVGKKKMASVLAEHICGANPITVCLGARRDDEELDLSFRGKTALDRIAEAVRRNPFSVIILADVDEADMLVRGSIKRAMERGRFVDSHGREISLGNIIFILTGNWSTVSLEEQLLDEKRLDTVASGSWQLKLTLGGKSAKRRVNWLLNKERAIRARKEPSFGLSLDLNQAADTEDDRTEGSLNSSDLTIDREDEHGHENRLFSVTSVPHELVSSSDGAIVFKPVHFGLVRREIEKTIMQAFSSVVDDKLSIEVEESSIERILAGLWFGRSSLEDWADNVLIPSFQQLKARLQDSSDENLVARLESDRDCDQVIEGDRLPSRITVSVDGV